MSPQAGAAFWPTNNPVSFCTARDPNCDLKVAATATAAAVGAIFPQRLQPVRGLFERDGLKAVAKDKETLPVPHVRFLKRAAAFPVSQWTGPTGKNPIRCPNYIRFVFNGRMLKKGSRA